MSELLDRKAQRKIIDIFFSTENPDIQVLWIEGPSGAGKTDLVRYIFKKNASDVIPFGFNWPFYRCRRGEENASYSMLEDLVAALEQEYPKLFEEQVGPDIKKFALPPLWKLLSKSVQMLPEGKTIHDLFLQDSTEAALAVKSQISNIIRPQQAAIAISSFLEEALSKKAGTQNRLLIGIDDCSWLNDDSFKILLASLNEVAKKGISCFVVLAIPTGRTVEEDSQAKRIEELIKDKIPDKITYVPVDLLDEEEGIEVIEALRSDLNREQCVCIYEATKGNFEEITTLIKRNERKIKVLYQEWLEANQSKEKTNNTVYSSILHEAFDKNELNLCVFSSIYILHGHSSLEVLVSVAQKLYSKWIGKRVIRIDIHETLNDLEAKGQIEIIEGHVLIHRKKLQAMKVYLIKENKYEALINFALEFYLNNFESLKLSRQKGIVEAVKLCVIQSPKEAADLFLSNYQKLNGQCDTELLIQGVQAILKVPRFAQEWAHAHVILKTMAIQLCEKNCFKETIEICDALIDSFESPELSRELYRSYLIALRESGQLNRENKPNWNQISQALNESQKSVADEIEDDTLLCSILEHEKSYEQIKEIYRVLPNKLNQICDPDIRTEASLSYVRNMGLAYFHGDIIADYEEGILLAQQSPNSQSFKGQLQELSLINQAGLGYFHTGQMEKAHDLFLNANKRLTKLGVFQETALNNLACVYIMQNKISEALDTLEAAKQVPLKPLYQQFSIDMNLSICLWLIGEHKYAKDLISPIAEKQRIVPDPSITATAQVNYAYMLMQNKEYEKAARVYLQSSTHKYRFLTQEYDDVQNFLRRYCAAKAGLILEEEIGDLAMVDIDGKRSKPYQRPYRLDLNSMYVVQ